MQPPPGSDPGKQTSDLDDLFSRLGARLDRVWQRLTEEGFFRRVATAVRDFWERVTEGLDIQDLWAQFVAEARASYSLYAKEVNWEALRRESRGRRILKTAGALFWAMILKLSPARRVFLLIALVLTVFSLQVQVASKGGAVSATGPNPFALLSIAALLVLLALELADRVIMKRDLEIAREIQRWLVPEVPPQVPGVEVAFTSRPANTVGGDYYDAFLLHGDGAGQPQLLLVVADVAGKSVPAALLMATFQASLRSLAVMPGSLRELVAGINRYACAHSLGGRRFTTACFAELDPATRTLTYIRAGHNAPIIRRASGDLEHLETGDLPLGIDPNVRFTCGVTTLAAGDCLLIFTDGLVEAVNAVGEELGETRLLSALKVCSRESAEKALKDIIAAVDAFAGRTRQHDDITCLVLRVV
jgi:serine phosphatase RsbU (regulator of sigma subunit)